jgi:ABC-type antimicrobial peptide transport system permease subunit
LDIDFKLPSDGEAIILTPSSATRLFSISRNDEIQLAYAKDVNVGDSILNIDHLLRLSKQLESVNYQYVSLNVSEIFITDDIDATTVFVPRGTYSAIIGQDHPYDTINVSIDSQLSLKEYNELKNELALWIHLTEDEEGDMALTATNNFFSILLRRAADYSAWLKIISALIPLLIIPVWYYPQTMIFSRRKEDYKILFCIGKTCKDIRKIFAAEALFAAIVAVIVTLICSPIGVLIFDIVVALYELPIEFNVRAFDFNSLGIGCIIGIIGAVVTVWIGYLMARKEIKKHGNS